MQNKGKPLKEDLAKTFIIVGYGRTGSSLLAGILHRMGISMGKEFRPADEYNETGFFENLDFVELNRLILHKDGYDMLNWPQKPIDSFMKYEELFADRAKRLVKKHRKDKWGWKDGRTIYTYPYYEEHLTNPHLIVCYRDTDSIIRSNRSATGHQAALRKRHSATWRKSINGYYDSVEDFHKKYPMPRMNIKYEAYFESYQWQLAKIAQFVEETPNEDAIRMFNPDLKHF